MTDDNASFKAIADKCLSSINFWITTYNEYEINTTDTQCIKVINDLRVTLMGKYNAFKKQVTDLFNQAAILSPATIKKRYITLSKDFTNECKRDINAAIPLIDNALGWQDYLLNLAKKLANAVIYLFNFGNVNDNSFFKIKLSDDTIKVVNTREWIVTEDQMASILTEDIGSKEDTGSSLAFCFEK